MNEREQAIEAALDVEYEKQKKEAASHNLYWSVASAFMAGYTAAESAWVPVEERLPEKSGRFLVTRRRRADGRNLTREAFFDTEHRVFEHPFNPFDPIKDVIAWTEKPSPYVPTNGGTDDA